MQEITDAVIGRGSKRPECPGDHNQGRILCGWHCLYGPTPNAKKIEGEPK